MIGRLAIALMWLLTAARWLGRRWVRCSAGSCDGSVGAAACHRHQPATSAFPRSAMRNARALARQHLRCSAVPRCERGITLVGPGGAHPPAGARRRPPVHLDAARHPEAICWRPTSSALDMG